MKEAPHAYRLLLAVSRVDGRVNRAELERIAHFRRLLGLGRVHAARIDREDDPGGTALEQVAKKDVERDDLMRLLFSVACADDDLAASEKRWLLAVSERLGIPRARYAALKMEALDHVAHRKRARRTQAFALATVVLAVLAVVLALRTSDEADGAVASSTVAFQQLELRHEQTVVLISVEYSLRRGAEEQRFQSSGSGFFVSADGLIATNKHVAEPWKFSAVVQQAFADGFQLEPLVRRWAWVSGARVFDQVGALDPTQAYRSDAGTLRLVLTAPDQMVPSRVPLPRGGEYVGVLHAANNNDLALLEASGSDAVAHVLLHEDDASISTLDAVMVLGFPHTLDVLESDHAVLSATVGTVRKAEETLHITAPVAPGNSGGPVFDADGRVIGVATRRLGDATYGGCIRVRHLARLIARAR